MSGPKTNNNKACQFPDCLKELIVNNEIDEPLLFKNIHEDWSPCNWSLDDWGDIFKGESLPVRYGQQQWDVECPQWESQCGKLDITWPNLIDWTNGKYALAVPDSSPKDIWLYYDYKYLPDVVSSPAKPEFAKDHLIRDTKLLENLKENFCWEKLGFPNRNGEHTTLWIGTAGCYTNAHFDTYSCNLVCQVYGHKTWLVFPPENTEYLQPTRVPYEESSVYSQINFGSGEQMRTQMSALKKCSPRRITLGPGDCLYLPPKWWHFVKSEDFSISVNTWVELPSDHFTRVEEAVLRSIVACYVNSTAPDTADIVLNPNEMDLADANEQHTEEILGVASKCFFEHRQIESEHESFAPEIKRPKLICANHSLQELLYNFSDKVQKLPICTIESVMCSSAPLNKMLKDYPHQQEQVTPPVDEQKVPCKQSVTYMEDLLNAVGHPDILKLIAEKFLKNVDQRNSST